MNEFAEKTYTVMEAIIILYLSKKTIDFIFSRYDKKQTGGIPLF